MIDNIDNNPIQSIKENRISSDNLLQLNINSNNLDQSIELSESKTPPNINFMLDSDDSNSDYSVTNVTINLDKTIENNKNNENYENNENNEIVELKNDQIDNLNNNTNNQIIVNEIIVNEIEEQIVNNNNSYKLSLKFYFIYVLYGFLGGIFINLITSEIILNFDMCFNVLISPIIYYNSPRKILTRLIWKTHIYFYTIPFIIGLFFRFLDWIPILSNFTLNVDQINTSIQITLLVILVLVSFIMIIYYIYISSEQLINSLLFIIVILFSSITFYYYLNNSGHLYFHHYFIGLIIMLLSKNSKYPIVVCIHALGYAVYIEGISRWGFGKIFWQNT